MDKSHDSTKEQLLRLARTAQQNAYARYSNFKVGAAILLENGESFTGCNVENASYGLTNCAERSAIFTAVSKLGGGNVKIRAVAVVNDHDVACSPCGACRQVRRTYSAPKNIEAIKIAMEPANILPAPLIQRCLPSGFRAVQTCCQLD